MLCVTYFHPTTSCDGGVSLIETIHQRKKGLRMTGENCQSLSGYDRRDVDVVVVASVEVVGMMTTTSPLSTTLLTSRAVTPAIDTLREVENGNPSLDRSSSQTPARISRA